MSVVVNPNTLFNFSQSADGLSEENILQLRHNLTEMMKGFNQISAFVLLAMTVFWIPVRHPIYGGPMELFGFVVLLIL